MNGCGLAGGYWKNYLDLINNFTEKSNTEVYIFIPGFIAKYWM